VVIWALILMAMALAEPHTELAKVACRACHVDPHGTERPCSDCHGATAWVPSSFSLTDHASTKFPLVGRHLVVPCASCHPNGKLAPLPTACARCHTDPHRGLLPGPCDKCHTANGWRPVPNFDHAQTGFALTGPHADLKCGDCHQGDRGRAMHQAATVTCRTCHVPDHGPFGGRACQSCHPTSVLTFAGALPFDHRQTAFPLARRHKVQPCNACHPPGPDPRADCAACHLDPHGGEMSVECDDCHRPDRWRLTRFDHDNTGFPLHGQHFVTPCGTCHTNQRWIGLPQACQDCHALDAARGPATPPHLTLAPCDDCHTSAWTWAL